MKNVIIFITLFFSFSIFASETFYFFYSYKCPHCVQAHPFIESLKKKYPKLEIKQMEIVKNEKNREICKKKVGELKIMGFGVPLFVMGKDYVVGFRKGAYEKKIENMIQKYIKKK